jgi:hypothetical protein
MTSAMGPSCRLVDQQWAKSVSGPLGRPSSAQHSKVQRRSSDYVCFGLVSFGSEGYDGPKLKLKPEKGLHGEVRFCTPNLF